MIAPTILFHHVVADSNVEYEPDRVQPVYGMHQEITDQHHMYIDAPKQLQQHF